MSLYNIVNQPNLAAGQPEDVGTVLANFQAIQAILNGGIDDANLRSTAAIAASKLSGYPSDGTKALFGDGSWKHAADKDSASIQAFTGSITAPQLSATSNSGVVAQSVAASPAFRNFLLAADANPSFQVSGTGAIGWGAGGASALDATLGRTGTAILGFTGTGVGFGLPSNAIGGGGSSGNYIGIGTSQPYITSCAASAVTGAFHAGQTGDSGGWRFIVGHDGKLTWGTGAGAGDTVLQRLAAGVLGDASNMNLSTGPLSNLYNGSQATGIYIGSNGQICTYNSAAFVAFNTGLTTDTVAGFSINYRGQLGWGTGAAAQDTLLNRASTGKGLIVSNFMREVGGVVSTYGAAPAIDASLGCHFTITITNNSAFTIAAPTNPPAAGQTQRICIELINASGATTGTFGFNAIYQGASLTGLALGTGSAARMMYAFQWSPTSSKWVYIGGSSSYA